MTRRLIPIPDGWLTTRDVAQRLGVSTVTVNMLRRRGLIDGEVIYDPVSYCYRTYIDPRTLIGLDERRQLWIEEQQRVRGIIPADVTREEYDFLRSIGYRHTTAVRALIAQLGISERTIGRHLDATEEVAA